MKNSVTGNTLGRKFHNKLSLILVFAMIFTMILAGFQKSFVSAEDDCANTVKEVKASVLQGKVERGTKTKLQYSTTGSAVEVTTEISAVTANKASGTVAIGTDIELSTETEGAEIFYTLDKTVPTTESAISYNGPIKIKNDTEIMALAYKEGKTSDVSKFIYKVPAVEKVKANIEPGDVEKGTEIKLSSTTGAAIYFTTDGTEPTTGSAVYVDPIKIDRDTIIKAFSTMKGHKNSEVVKFNYTLKNSISVQNICDVDKFKVGKLAEIKLLIGNNTVEKKDVTLLMASYDENNSMLNYVLVNENIGSRDRVELSGFMRVTEKSKVVKCFAIDSLEGMTPISNSVIVPVE